MSKHAGWLAKCEAEQEELTTVSPDGGGVFRITKQMDCENQEFVGEICVSNDSGEHGLTDEDKMKAYVERYAWLINVEFEWPSNELSELPVYPLF